MALDYYDDRAIIDVYDPARKEIETGVEFYDARGLHPQGESHATQLINAFSHWCINCECAFRKGDVDGLNPICPLCGEKLDEFDLENIVPDYSMDIEEDEEGNWKPKGD